VVAVAASAFRFRPKDEDRDRIEGEVPRGLKIWLKPLRDGDPLEFVKVDEGVSDDAFSQVSCANADSLVGREAVIGYQLVGMEAPGAQGGDSKNPFMPKFPKRGKNKGTAPEPRK